MAVLEKIRVKMGWLITALIAVALLSFILDPSTLSSALSMFSSKYDVGEIAGEGITYQEYQQKVDYFNQIYQITSGSTTSNEQTQELVNNTAWQNEITERVIMPAIESAGITLGADELYDLTQGANISPVLLQDGAFVDESGKFSKQKVAQFVQAIPQDQSGQLSMYWNYIEDNIVKSQMVEKYLSLLQHSMYLNPVELNKAIAENNVTYNVDFVVKPFGFSLDSTIVVSDSEAKKYYEENKVLFEQPESRDLEYAVFEVVPSQADIDATSADMEKTYAEFVNAENMKNFLARNSDQAFVPYYYKEGELSAIATELEDFAAKAKVGETLAPFQVENVFIAAKVMDVRNMSDEVFVKHILLIGADEAKADSLLAVAKKGDFAQLAAQYSADKNPNVAEAGDLGMMSQQNMIPGMEDVLKAKVGDVFKVKTSYGTHIVKIKDATAPVRKAQVALLVKEAVASKVTYSEHYAKANELASRAEGKLDLFNEVAKEMGVSVNPAYRVLPGAKALGSYQNTREITRWANENEPGTVSPIITVDNKYFFVVGVKAAHAEGYTPYSEVAPTIKNYLTVVKQGEKVAAETKELVAGVSSIEEVAEKLNTTVSNQSGIAFSSLTAQQLDPKFIGAIAAAQEGVLSGPVVGEIGVYYFTIKGKETGAFYTEDDAKARNMQIFSSVQSVIPVILTEKAGVKDQRYKFY